MCLHPTSAVSEFLVTSSIKSASLSCFQVWDATKRVPRLIQEVREHTKAVTCLYVPSSRDKLYSGSLDKTIRVSHMVIGFALQAKENKVKYQIN